MKKSITLFFSLLIGAFTYAQTTKSVTLTKAGSLSTSVSNSEKSSITNLSIAGKIDARDFKTMRDSMPLLASIDLSAATIVSYTGKNGTDDSSFISNIYPANTIPYYAFENQSTWLGKATLKSIILPNSLKEIGQEAFEECTNLQSVSLPESLTTIGIWAFMDCWSLQSIVIPNSVTTISKGAFGNCSGITSLSIPPSVTSIGEDAFEYCSSLTSLQCLQTFPVEISGSKNVFNGINKNICTLYIPSSALQNYASANQWNTFPKIKEILTVSNSAIHVSFTNQSSQSIVSTVNSLSDVLWTVSSDKSWLTLSPMTETKRSSTISITTNEANPTNNARSATITVKSLGQILQTISVEQSGKAFNITTPGTLSQVLDTNKKNLTYINITGTIDARDFKTMRDSMPNLTSIDVSGATIVAYNGSLGTYPYSNIYLANVVPQYAFCNYTNNQGKTSLTSIILPSSVTSIDNRAFYKCSGLTSFIVPPLVTNIADYSFYQCSGLTSVSIPNAATSIGNYAFYYCSSLTSVNIPASVKTIGYNAFYNCTSLKSVTIPASITTIGSYAFYYCTNLSSVIANSAVPLDLTNSSYVFYNVPTATCKLTVPYGSLALYKAANQWSAFINTDETGISVSPNAVTVASTDGSQSVIQVASNTTWKASADQLWITCSTKDYVNGNASVTITASANPNLSVRTANVIFTSDIDTVKVPVTQTGKPAIISSVAGGLSSTLGINKSAIIKLILTGTIDARDFKTMRDSMPNLTSIDLNGANIVAYNGKLGTADTNIYNYAANDIPQYAFYNNNKGQAKITLTSILLPTSLTSINNSAFYQCSGLNTITIPNSVTSIGNSAFRNCYSLASISIPISVTTIQDYAFSNSGIQSISIPSSVSYLGYESFYNCTSLVSANIQSTNISSWAFEYCTQLKSLVISASVNQIGSGAFYNCKLLSSIISLSQIPINLTSSSSVFYNVNTSTCTLSVPYGAKQSYQVATIWKDFYSIQEMNLAASPSVANIDAKGGSTVAIQVTSNNVKWKATSNQTWLTLNQTDSIKGNATLTATASANTSNSNRFATITIATANASTTVSIIQAAKPQTVSDTAGGLSAVLGLQKATITNLILAGNIDARDFKTMRDSMPNLASVDLSAATIVSYSGIYGTYPFTSGTTYPANSIPDYAFYDGYMGVGKVSLTSVILPTSITGIGYAAFRYCNNLKTITTLVATPIDLSKSYNSFYGITPTCTLQVPNGSIEAYQAANQWSIFYHLSTSSNQANVNQTGDLVNVNVLSNAFWTASSDQNWLTVVPNSKTFGNALLTLSASANTSYPRKATVSIIANGLTTQTILVTQNGLLKIDSIKAIQNSWKANYNCIVNPKLITFNFADSAICPVKSTIGTVNYKNYEPQGNAANTTQTYYDSTENALRVNFNYMYGLSNYSDYIRNFWIQKVKPVSQTEAFNPFKDSTKTTNGGWIMPGDTVKGVMADLSDTSRRVITVVYKIVGLSTTDSCNLRMELFDVNGRNTNGHTVKRTLGGKTLPNDGEYHTVTLSWNGKSDWSQPEGGYFSSNYYALNDITQRSFSDGYQGDWFGIPNGRGNSSLGSVSPAAPNGLFGFDNSAASHTSNGSSIFTGDKYDIPLDASHICGFAFLLNDGNSVQYHDQTFSLIIKNIQIGDVSLVGTKDEYVFGNPKIPTLTVMNTNVQLLGNAGSKATISILSNVKWTATSDQSWLTVSPQTATGNGILTLSGSLNLTASRVAKVTISANGVPSKIITVTQGMSTPIVSVSPSSISATLTACSDTLYKTVTIKNQGYSDLIYNYSNVGKIIPSTCNPTSTYTCCGRGTYLVQFGTINETITPGYGYSDYTLPKTEVTAATKSITSSLTSFERSVITANKNTMLANCNKGDVTSFGTKWYTFNDSSNGGKSIISPMPTTAFPHFTMTAPGANATDSAAVATYTLSQGTYTYDPYVGFGFYSTSDMKKGYDFTGSTGISFYHKGDAVNFQVGLETITDFCDFVYAIPAHTDWTLVTVNWTDLVQPNWGKSVTFDKSIVTRMQWQKGAATGTSGTIGIDEVQLNGVSIDVSVPPSTDKPDLITTIKKAQAEYDAAVEGTTVGNYPVGAKTTLLTAIIVANIAYKNSLSGIKTEVSAGKTYQMYVKTGSSYNEHVGAWIDFNNNGTFENTELVMNSNNVLIDHFASVSIPKNTKTDVELRMRIISEYGAYSFPSPCSSSYYLQAEDYIVIVKSSAVAGSGTLAPSDSIQIQVPMISSGKTKGTYTNAFTVTSNDPQQPLVSIPISLTLDTKPVIKIKNDLTSPTIMQNTDSTSYITIYNSGCDTLRCSSIKTSSTDFIPSASSLNIPMGDSVKLAVTFKPSLVKTYNETLTIHNNSSDIVLQLSGAATGAPQLTAIPSKVTATLTSCNDTTYKDITIYNTGTSDLNFNYYYQSQSTNNIVSATCKPTPGYICCGMGTYNVQFAGINDTLTTQGTYKDYNASKEEIATAISSLNSAVTAFKTKVNSSTAKNTIIASCNKGGTTFFGTQWYSYASGTSTIIPFSETTGKLNMTSPGANGTDSAAVVSGSLNKPTSPDYESTGIGFSFSYPETDFSLLGATGISFWHKGDALAFNVVISTVKPNAGEDFNYTVPAHASWTLVTVPFTSLQQPSWATKVSWDASKVTRLQWIVKDAPARSYSFGIDEVQVNGLLLENIPSSVRTNLNSAITNAQSVYGTAIEGIALGQYPSGSKATLLSAITTAQSVYNKSISSKQAIVLPDQTYSLYVKTSTSYKEHVGAWIDYNNNGSFESTELVMNSNAVMKDHFASISIPASAQRGVKLRMRVISSYNSNAFPTSCVTSDYIQAEDYSVVVANSRKLAAGDTAKLRIPFTSTGKLQGTYSSYLVLSSNDPLHLIDSIPLTLNADLKPSMSFKNSDSLLKFSPIMQLTSDTKSFYMSNKGCDSLNISVQSSSSEFVPSPAKLTIMPGDSAQISVTFNPTLAKSYNETLYLYNNEKDTTVALHGVSLSPPIMQIVDKSISHTFSSCSDSIVIPVTIKNTGDNNLIEKALAQTTVNKTISYSQLADTIKPGDSYVFNVTMKTNVLPSGLYNSLIKIQSNDPLKAIDTIKVSVNIKGQPKIALSDTVFAFGKLMQYTYLLDSFNIKNTGCDTLKISSFTNSDRSFSVDKKNLFVLPFDSQKVVAVFAPLRSGILSNTLTIKSNDGTKLIKMTGSSSKPPILSLSSDSIQATVTNCDDSTSKSFIIKNKGSDSLEFTYQTKMKEVKPTSCFPYSTGFGSGGIGTHSISFGTFSHNPVFEGGIQDFSASQIIKVKAGETYTMTVKTGPNYSENVSAWIDYNNNTVFEDNELVMTTQGYNIQSATVLIPNHTVKNAGLRMRVISVDAYYGKPTPCYSTWGLQSEDYTVVISNDIIAGSGKLAPNDSTIIEVPFSSTGFVNGDYQHSLEILTNDPLRQKVSVPVILHDRGKADIAVSKTAFMLNPILQYTSVNDTLFIKNTGCDTLKINSFANKLSYVTISPKNINIMPYDSQKIVLTFHPLVAGTLKDTISIFNNVQTIKLPFVGISKLPPVMKIATDSINQTFTTCSQNDSVIVPFTIKNTGDTTLLFTLSKTGSFASKAKIAIIGADNNSYLNDVQTKLQNTGNFLSVDIINVTSYTPTLAELKKYDAVLVYSNYDYGYYFYDAATLGNNLADYADQGGGVVCSEFSFYTYSNIGGRFNTGNYFGIAVNSYKTGNASLGTAELPNHFILKNIKSFNGGYYSYRSTGGITIGATRIADWSDGSPLVVTKEFNNVRHADLGFFPPSSDVNSSYWNATTDGAKLMANALIWVSHRDIPTWVATDIVSGSILKGDSSKINVTLKSKDLTNGKYQSNIIVSSNDPVHPTDTIACSLAIKGMPLLSISKTHTFDSTMQWTSRVDSVYIKNVGCDTMKLSTITNKTLNFTSSISKMNILPADSAKLYITFKPTVVGNTVDSLFITGNITKSFMVVKGKGTYPPVIKVSPDTIRVTVAACNDTLTVPLTIKNNGYSPLKETVTAISDDGLVAYYPFDGNAYDASGNGKNGAVYNATLTNDRNGNPNKAYYFDGTSSHIELGNWFGFQNFTISMWVNHAVSQYGLTDLIENNYTGTRSWTFQSYYNNYGSNNSWFNKSFSLNLNQWQHVVITKNATSASYYVDGTLIQSIPAGTITYDGTQQLGLARWYNNGAIQRFWNGSIDEVKIFNKTLSQSEVLALDAKSVDYVSISPATDTIGLVDSAKINIGFNGKKASIGNHSGYLNIASNDPLHANIQIPYIVTVVALPQKPIGKDTAICFGNASPALTAKGTGIKWYADKNGVKDSLIVKANQLTTADTAANKYLYYATQTDALYGCESVADTVTLTINDIPLAPTAKSQELCSFQTIPDLSATGTAITWYSDSLLKKTVYSGNPFTTGDTLGIFKYYATQTVNKCESKATKVSLTINPAPVQPVATNQQSCYGGSIPDLTAVGTYLRWYADSTLSSIIHRGSPFKTGKIVKGIYNYYVTQAVDTNMCSSKPMKVTLTIDSVPLSPIAVAQETCFGSSNPVLTAIGKSITWYSDKNATTVIATGNSYLSNETTAKTYTYYFTQTTNCGISKVDSTTLTIHALPVQPIAKDQLSCEDSPNSNLTVTGTAIRWYSDSALTLSIHSGATLFTAKSNVGSYSYYVTQTVNACQSLGKKITLQINPLPVAPAVTNQISCFGKTVPALRATVTNGKWYSDATLKTLVSQGDSLATGKTAVNTYNYYVNDSVNGCNGAASLVSLTIKLSPIKPTATDKSVCFGKTVPNLTASGVSIKWYKDQKLDTLLYSGDSYATGKTDSGKFVYYATQTNLGCEGPATAVALHISTPQKAPVVTSQFVCYGAAVSDLTAVGNDLNWYSDSLMTGTPVNTGTTFTTGETDRGIYKWYVTQGVGCESKPSTATLTIYAPNIPITTDTSVCDGSVVPDLTAVGTNVKWYGDKTLTTVLSTGNIYNTGKSTIGSYSYYVNQTDAKSGCVSDTGKVTLNILAIPTAPIASNETIFEAQPVPSLVATGTNVVWYSDSLLKQQIGAGNSYPPSQTKVGIYYFWATQSNASCTSSARKVMLQIKSIPQPPISQSKTICFGQPTPDLIAVGTKIQWFSDSARTKLVYKGDTLKTAITATGIYTYYATQSDPNDGGLSRGTKVTLTIKSKPLAPVVSNVKSCFGSVVPNFTTAGTNVQWFNDSLLTNKTGSGNTFITDKTAVGNYSYYVIDSLNGCLSDTVKTSLTINAIPSAPLAQSVVVCETETIPSLNATGTGITWFSDSLKQKAVFSGSSFATTKTAIGVYPYFVAQTDANNGCYGDIVKVSLSIVRPSVPTTSNKSICFGDPTPDLTATGTAVQWYNTATLDSVVNIGETYTTGITALGSYNYYVTQSDTVLHCESLAKQVTLNISTPPLVTVTASASTVCSGSDLTLTASGASTYVWNNGVTNAEVFHPTASQTYLVTASNPLGCGNTASIVVMVNQLPSVTATASNAVVCAGTVTTLQGTGILSYTWDNGVVDSKPFKPTTSNTYTVTGTDGNGCSNTATVAVKVNSVTNDTISIKACSSYLWNGKTYLNSGIYTDSLKSGLGCDSIVTVKLSISKPSTSDTVAIACQSFKWYDSTFTSSGNHIRTFTSSTGCDSVVTLHVTINQPSKSDTVAVACGSFTWYGTLYAMSTTQSKTFKNITGCDSVVTLHLTINKPSTGDTSVTTCGSFRWYGKLYTTSGLPTHTFTNKVGCDSIVTLHLTINPSTNDTLTKTVCGSFTWNNQTYTSSGMCTQRFMSTGGCDSVVTYKLTVIQLPNTAVVTSSQSVCSSLSPFPFTAKGNKLHWFSDSTLKTEVYVGATLSANVSTAGNQLYYLQNEDSLTGCRSSKSLVSITVKQSPLAPVITNVSGCIGDVLPNITAIGKSVNWYLDQSLINLVYSGNTLTVKRKKVGQDVYYVTQTDTNNCSSSIAIGKVTMNPKPLLILSSYRETIVKGDSITLSAFNADSYVWSPLQGLSMSNSGTMVAKPVKSIVYTVTGTNSEGCWTKDSVSIIVTIPSDTTAISIVDSKACKVYPNPANDFIIVTLNVKKQTDLTFDIFNYYGQKVLSKTKEQQSGSLTERFDISSLSDGVYHIQITSKDKSIFENRRIDVIR